MGQPQTDRKIMGEERIRMTDSRINIYPVLLAGGSGTRLWPVSRELYPKQLASFIGGDSLVQSTVKRLAPVLDKQKVRIVCGIEHYHEVARHMEDIGVSSDGKIICEPCGRNTAPAILLAILTILKTEEDAVLCIFPADHVIREIGIFRDRLIEAVKLAESGHIVTFGIKPGYPETGYGYIEGAHEVDQGALAIKRFVEKPDRATAESYIRAGNFFWNSGMFAFRASVIVDEFKAFQPELFDALQKLPLDNSISREAYEVLPNISIDYAIMEKTDKGVVLPSDFGWSDIGSWKSLYDFLPKDDDMNVIDGDVIAKNTRSSFIMGRERLITTNRLRNMVVVDTPDSVFVSDIDNSRDVKEIVDELKKKGRAEYHIHRTVYYPWGSATLLDRRDECQVEKMVLYPDAVIEDVLQGSVIGHLVITSGSVNFEKGVTDKLLVKGEAIRISASDAPKLKNTGCDPALMLLIRMR
ncbi:mannose-1-phosphate guanylyltransferase/mannose-6-phosphate isomerase [Thermodesulfobacteriota bacterium]